MTTRRRSLLRMLAATVLLVAVGVASLEASEVKVRVAAISFVPVKFDLPGNADRLEAAFREAKQGGAQIAVAPEGILEGYVVNEIIAGDYPAEKMNDVAVPLDDPVIQRFQNLARELDMSLVFGLAERIGDDVYNCAVFIDHEGVIRGKYHKMQLAEGYDPDWWFNRLGKASRAFDTPYGRAGILICNDRWNPNLARIPVLDGAQFLLIPSMGSRSRAQDDAVVSRSRENSVPIVEANVGVTLIADDDKIIAVDREEEGITYADITIPPATAPNEQERDHVEQEFLKWREQEMKVRLQKTLDKLKDRADPKSSYEPEEGAETFVGIPFTPNFIPYPEGATVGEPNLADLDGPRQGPPFMKTVGVPDPVDRRGTAATSQAREKGKKARRR